LLEDAIDGPEDIGGMLRVDWGMLIWDALADTDVVIAPDVVGRSEVRIDEF
jgi:hypothetical protein